VGVDGEVGSTQQQHTGERGRGEERRMRESKQQGRGETGSRAAYIAGGEDFLGVTVATVTIIADTNSPRETATRNNGETAGFNGERKRVAN
jgi:tRNA(Ile2) C34 agmatinyltransferase TiaS